MAGFIALWFFLTRTPCRIVTTSADHNQLKAVLWGEIRRWIQTCRIPLDYEKGGPLVINDLLLRKIVNGKMCGISYCIGRVAAKGEGLLGHHVAAQEDGIPRTLGMIDEASGVDDMSYERMTTWARRIVAVGNCYSSGGFFYKGIKQGDLIAPPKRGDVS